MSGSNCCLLTYIQFFFNKVVWYFHLFKNFPQLVVIHIVRGFPAVTEADVFLEFPCLFYDLMDIGNLISGSSTLSKSSSYIWKLLVHVLLKPGVKDIEYYLASMWNECNCMVVWIFFGIAFLWDCDENWPLPVLWPLMNFPNYYVHHIFFILSSVDECLGCFIYLGICKYCCGKHWGDCIFSLQSFLSFKKNKYPG